MEKTDLIVMSYLVMRWLSNKLFFCDFDDFVQGVSVYVKTSYCFDYDVAAFSQSIESNLLSRCVFQGPAWKSVVLATD